MENTLNKKTFGIINSNTLRLIACALMLMDHMWATVIPGNNWMTYAGRLAFPIFAFQIVEGFFHTSDVRGYAKRLLIFALISEIPFNMMLVSSPIYPFHQNVMFTLLIGLLVINELEKLRSSFSGQVPAKQLLICVLKIAGLLILSVFGFVDYGIYGVLTIILFYAAHYVKWSWAVQIAGIIYINFFALKGLSIPVFIGSIEYLFPTQGFAVFSLLLIWLYNGKKGRSSKALQYEFYAFYPVHMLVLALIRLWA
ncbi:MAG: conjugal transfer protein TraX [Firmicutes bacterium]|nr:conjugal transfer protein TraX [Bacillota bacterium]